MFKTAKPLGKFELKNITCLIPLCFNLSLAIKLLEEMLSLDADHRITAEIALAHPYLVYYADPQNEPVSEPYNELYEDMEFGLEKWKG